MRYEEAIQEAESMMDLLRPACLGGKIAIAGSLRRRSKEDFDEIDLIMIPDPTPPPLPRAVFGKPIPKIYSRKIDQIIDELAESEKIHITQSGPRGKKFLSLSNELSFDLSIIFDPATWGVMYAIRTGPKDFSHFFVTQRNRNALDPDLGHVRGGALPDGYRVQAGAVWEGETRIPEKELRGKTPIGFDTEEAFLDFLGLGWIEPGDRRARWGSMNP